MIYSADFFLCYSFFVYLKQKSISPSLVSENAIFLKQGYFFLFIFQLILWTNFSTSSLSAQRHYHNHNHNHNHSHNHHLKAKKRGGYLCTHPCIFSSYALLILSQSLILSLIVLFFAKTGILVRPLM